MGGADSMSVRSFLLRLRYLRSLFLRKWKRYTVYWGDTQKFVGDKSKVDETLDQEVALLLAPKKPARVWILQTVLLLLVLGPTVFFGYQFARNWRVKKFEKTAHAAWANGDQFTAWQTIHAAHLMKPGDIDILRFHCEVASGMNHPKAIEWLRDLQKMKGCTLVDRENFASVAVLQKKSEWLEDALEQCPDPIGLQVYQLFLAISRGPTARPEAYELAKRLLPIEPPLIEVHKVYWDVCMQSEIPSMIQEGFLHMRSIAKQKDSLGQEALRLLLQHSLPSQFEKTEWAQRLLAFENNVTQADALLCLTVSTDSNSGLDYQQLEDTLKREEPSSHSELDVAQFLGRMGRQVDAVAYLVKKNRGQLSKPELAFYQSILTSWTGDERKSMAYLTIALREAKSKDLERLGRLIQFHKNPEVSLAFLKRVDELGKLTPDAMFLMALAYQRLGLDHELKQILTKIPKPVKETPPQVIEQLCRWKVLFNQDVVECRKLMEDLVSRYPQTASYRFVLSLCYWKNGYLSEARAILGDLLNGPPPSCPSLRLIGALTLSGGDDQEGMSEWLPHQDKARLLESERLLFDQLIKI